MTHGTRQCRWSGRKNEKDYLSPAELTDDEARGQITKVRSPRQKRGSSVFWSLEGRQKACYEGNSEKVLRGGELFEMPRRIVRIWPRKEREGRGNSQVRDWEGGQQRTWELVWGPESVNTGTREKRTRKLIILGWYLEAAGQKHFIP